MDVINVVCMMLYDIYKGKWSSCICDLFDIFMEMLFEVLDCVVDFGVIDVGVLGVEILIFGVVGDQQVVIIGQVCFESGMMKFIYGMGCFVLMNIGGMLVKFYN